MTELTDHSKEAQLQVRWLGKVRYRDALAIQQIITSYERGNYLLLLEHHPVYTMGIRASKENLKIEPEAIGAELEKANRGGDITFHGTGWLAIPYLNWKENVEEAWLTPQLIYTASKVSL